MKKLALISALLLTTTLAFSQNITSRYIAAKKPNFIINSDNQNFRSVFETKNLQNKIVIPKNKQIRLVTKTGVLYMMKFSEFENEEFSSEKSVVEPSFDQEFETRIKGKTDYSTRQKN